jgi:hypothetical protein
VDARVKKESWPCRLATLKLTITPTFSVEVVSEEEKIS